MEKISLWMTNRENSRLLSESLDNTYKVVVAKSFSDVTSVDLIIVDGVTLNSSRRELELLRESKIFLPILLVTSRNDVKMATKELWKIVDDVIIAPVERNELLIRIKNLLKLRYQSERLRREHWVLTDSSPIGIAILTGGKETYRNPRMDRILLGKSFENVLKGEERERFTVFCKRAENNREPLSNLFRVEVNGSTKWLEMVACQIDVEKEPGIIVMTQDSTESIRTTSELVKTQQKLQEAFVNALNLISSLVERRDPFTYGHQRRVTSLAVKIAESMELKKSDIDTVKYASLVHDLGKVVVPTEILSKPGKLDETEMALIREHAKQGYEMISELKIDLPIAEAVYQHHERLDGSGYPRGLKGEEISIHARIIGVADVVEAMSSHRPYRAALGVRAAIDEIESGSGRIYDREVVRHCKKIIEEGFAFEEEFEK
ncbi:HD domain-containing phosphohydrolase [Mesotoga sp. H07.pep.5.3]|uniref:HD domain-containing phosphohydrolase n=1 Tax=Mesotoga sp. H07.pep.5.3 TaxID=1421003 RepID=UPI000C1912B5|nr:HD domain-containing phosphohydrolase [Mesotoga sp. H07.pep.5.3]